MIKLSNAGKANLGPLTFQFFVRGQALPLLLKLDGWSPSGFYYPPTREEKERKERDEREKGKVSLHLLGVYGAIWLGDGTGADLSDATSMTGLGVRAQYAFNRYWAVEGELMGASTGSAHFEDVTYDGAQGDLARSASIGRAQFGGVLRLGSGAYVLPLRLGVGGQGGSHAATFNDTEEPDLPFDFSALWYAGAGLDVRLGDHFLAGIALTMETPVSSDYELSRRTIEAGIHLGYSWRP